MSDCKPSSVSIAPLGNRTWRSNLRGVAAAAPEAGPRTAALDRLLATALLCLFGLSGCSLQDEHISQTVAGRLLTDGGAPTGEIKILSWSEVGCRSSGTVAQIDRDGAFRLTRTVERGRLAVVVQDDLVCLRRTDSWEVLWHSGPYGPATEKL